MMFGGIKRNTTDILFSNIVRTTAKWICERCFRDFSSRREVFDCSHFITRGNKRTRWDFENASALCRGCHDYFGKNPLEHYEFMKKKLGEEKLNLLRFRSNRQLHDFKIDEKSVRMGLKIHFKKLQKEIEKLTMGGR